VLEEAMLLRRIARRSGLDGNPLRRRSDRLEAWLVMVLLAGVVLGGPPLAWQVGEVAYDHAARASELDRRHRFPVGAVLVEDSVRRSGTATDRAQPQSTRVRARWTGPDGTPGDGVVNAEVGAKAGSVVVIWTNEHGAVTQPPVERYPSTDALVAGLLTMFVLAAGGRCLLLVVRVRLNRRRMERWQTQWTLVEPVWSGRR
jgi:hypothetical protein